MKVECQAAISRYCDAGNARDGRLWCCGKYEYGAACVCGGADVSDEVQVCASGCGVCDALDVLGDALGDGASGCEC